MANVIKTCKVCGKKYEGCSDAEKYDGVFRWQTVTCSPECGAIYLADVCRARGEKIESNIDIDSIDTNTQINEIAEAEKVSAKRSRKKKDIITE